MHIEAGARPMRRWHTEALTQHIFHSVLNLTRALLPRALQHWPRVHSMSAVGWALLLSWSMIASASRACHKQQMAQTHVHISIERRVLVDGR